MGKSRRNRAGTVRANPMAAPPKPVKAPADPALAALREKTVLPVVRDLRSADPAKRTAAAGAIASVVANDDASGRVRKLLLREQVVHVVLTETLTDARVESRAAGWAVLVVLALHEAPDFCVHLFRCDVLTPAAHALGQAVDALVGPSAAAAATSKAEARFAWTVATAVLDLVGHLAAARDEILDAVLANEAIGRGFAALATGVVPASGSSSSSSSGSSDAAAPVAIPAPVQWAALTGLGRLLMADDLPASERKRQQALAKALVEDGPVYAALRVLVAADGPLAVAAASLLHNVFSALEWFDHSPGPDGESDAVLVPALAGALRRELQEQEKRGQRRAGASDDADTGKDQSDQVCSLALETLAMMGTTLSRSLEKGNVAEAVWDGIRDDDGNELTIDGNDESEEDEEDDEDEDRDMTDAAAAPRKAANGHSGGGGMDIDMEEDGEGAGDSDADDADDGEMIDLDRDMEAVTGGADDDDQPGGVEDMATLQALQNVAIPQTIEWIEKHSAASSASASASASPDADQPVLDGIAVLNNCAWSLSCLDADDDGNAALLQAWAPTAEAIWRRVVRPLLPRVLQQHQHAAAADEADAATADSDLANQLAGLAWAVARALRGATPVDDEVDSVFTLHQLSSSSFSSSRTTRPSDTNPDPFQSESVKWLGVLGQLAQGAAAPLDRNRAVGRYLVGVVEALPSQAPQEAVEALDQLFDLYGDETAACDRGVFWPEGFLERLAAVERSVKAMAKTVDKRTDTELRARADEAVLNLRRFLQYKRKHAPVEK